MSEESSSNSEPHLTLKYKNGVDNHPLWVQNLLEHFSFVGKSEKDAKDGDKTLKRICYELSCNICDLNASAQSDKQSKGKTNAKKKSVNITGNSSCAFSRHLQRRHPGNHNPSAYASASRAGSAKKRRLSDDDTIAPSLIGGSEKFAKSVATANIKYDKNGTKQTIFNELVLNLIVRAGLPLNTVEKDEFTICVEFLDPKMATPSRRKLKRILRDKCDKIRNHLAISLKALGSGTIHLILDIWSSRQRISVIGVQVRYIRNWQICQQLIGFAEFPGCHDSESIRKKVEGIVRSFGLSMEDFLTVTADNASAILNAFKDYSFENTVVTGSQQLNGAEVLEGNASVCALSTLTLLGDVESEDELLDIDEEHNAEVLSDTFVDEEINSAIDTVIADWSAKDGLKYVRQNSCLAHLLQLGIRDALKSEFVNKLMKKVNSTITWFNKSNKQYMALRKETKLGFVKPCDTRWNATCLCLQRLTTICKSSNNDETEETFAAVTNRVLHNAKKADKRSKPPPEFTDDEITSMVVISSLLEPFLELTNTWQGDGITCSTVIIGLLETMTALQNVPIEDGEENLQKFKKSLFELVFQRFQTKMGQKPIGDQSKRRLVTVDIFNDKYYILSTVLDPRLKTIPFEEGFVSDFAFRNGYPDKSAVDLILKEAFDRQRKLRSQDVVVLDDSSSSGEKSSETNSVSCGKRKGEKFGIFDRISQHQASKKLKNQEYNEINQYLSSPIIGKNDQPLKFWKSHQDVYPILSQLALKYLSMPATSASVERLFSVAGAIISYRRCSMKIGTAANMILYSEYLRDKKMS